MSTPTVNSQSCFPRLSPCRQVETWCSRIGRTVQQIFSNPANRSEKIDAGKRFGPIQSSASGASSIRDVAAAAETVAFFPGPVRRSPPTGWEMVESEWSEDEFV